MAKTECSFDMLHGALHGKLPARLVGRLISLSLGLFMVLGTCTLR